MKQTAIEWFANELYEKFEMRGDGNLFDEIYEQAKEMEKEQIICAGFYINKEKYYKDKYKSNLEPQLIPRKEYLSIKEWFKQFKTK